MQFRGNNDSSFLPNIYGCAVGVGAKHRKTNLQICERNILVKKYLQPLIRSFYKHSNLLSFLGFIVHLPLQINYES
jgi:hypothetical protein